MLYNKSFIWENVVCSTLSIFFMVSLPYFRENKYYFVRY
jgi:hypothetical protein